MMTIFWQLDQEENQYVSAYKELWVNDCKSIDKLVFIKLDKTDFETIKPDVTSYKR